MHILDLLLAVINFLKKNSIIILSIIKGVIRLKSVKKPVTGLIIGLTIDLVTELIIS